MEINIRKLAISDQEKVEGLFLAKSSILKWNFPKFLDHSDCFGIVLEKNSQIIGFGALIRYNTPLHGTIGRLEDIFVHPDHQKKGYGKKIINELILLGEQLKLLQIVLTSNPKRAAARHLYTSLGFDLHETGIFVKNLS
ncbi:MAG: GNAT family N-acetyltransferase [Patescibacteria group bacterium]|jgi:GNAT superfamily N-acetyltransferase|nr:GNAT family N-acetyltransferase [Patescibacteria group bacterium]